MPFFGVVVVQLDAGGGPRLSAALLEEGHVHGCGPNQVESQVAKMFHMLANSSPRLLYACQGLPIVVHVGEFSLS